MGSDSVLQPSNVPVRGAGENRAGKVAARVARASRRKNSHAWLAGFRFARQALNFFGAARRRKERGAPDAARLIVPWKISPRIVRDRRREKLPERHKPARRAPVGVAR
jgi:hypothetical protein